MRHLIAYHPELGLRLQELAGTKARPLWLRLGPGGEELFCAFPEKYIYLENQSIVSNTESQTLTDFSNIADFWQALPALLAELPQPDELGDLPFRGGLAGFIGYDGSQPAHLKRLSFPDAFFGLYPHFVHINHAQETATKVSLPGYGKLLQQWSDLVENASSITNPERSADAFSLSRGFEPLTSLPQYRQNFQHIQRYLLAGDCYQVNYAQAFRAHCQGSTEMAMRQLLHISNPAYAAWLSLPEGEVLSLSPELFVQTEKGRITTRPIKGTAPRANDPDTDMALRQNLQDSRKNQAENLMIVDLLRHDISQHAETGSVKVDKLFEVESLPQVHHLVSTITANLKKGSQSVDLIRDCFPGGSITGAPKKRAMEIIAELEPTPRSVYCGSIGFINADGDAHFNIAIRTLLRLDDEIYIWAGGGIVADSDCESEYQECFDKIGALMRALEAMGKP
ncbi:MAG: aminodeoxychorismate synthase component I [bacterium]|nr:aminodeoxychorismate synthase component I [bacterium]